MFVFTEYFFPRKTFIHEIPFRCNNNAVIQGEIHIFDRQYTYVIKAFNFEIDLLLINFSISE